MSWWDPDSDYSPVNTDAIALPRRVDDLARQIEQLRDLLASLAYRVELLEKYR